VVNGPESTLSISVLCLQLCNKQAMQQGTSMAPSSLLTGTVLGRLGLITLRSALDPILLRTAVHNRAVTATGAGVVLHQALGSPWPVDDAAVLYAVHDDDLAVVDHP
jgi:hypothetical protein